jgi:hypothetical protein
MKMRELFNVGFLASANVAGSAVQNFFQGMEPLLHFLIGLGQLGVAVVTIWYIWRKIKASKQKNEKTD